MELLNDIWNRLFCRFTRLFYRLWKWSRYKSVCSFIMDFGLLLMLEEERRANRSSQMINRRRMRDDNNPTELSEQSFRTSFRISREMDLALIHSIENDVRRTRSHGLPVHIVVSILSNYYLDLCLTILLLYLCSSYLHI